MTSPYSPDDETPHSPGPDVPSSPDHADRGQGPGEAAAPVPSRKRRRWALWLIGGATALLLICCGSVIAVINGASDEDAPTGAPSSQTPAGGTGNDATPSTTKAAPPATQAAPPPQTTSAAPPAPEGVGDGSWLVPADIKPSTYYTVVPDDSAGCYWQRAKNAEGDLDSILANDNVAPGGHVVVTITKSDKAFKTEGCGEWSAAPRSGPKATMIGEGTWAVGIDIAPGTYAVTVPEDSTGCYWQRMKDFTGGLESILANENVDAGARATVTIKATDKGFKSSGCGTWRKR